ncbi:transcriptional regulator [Micromonospora sp. NPDC002575]|uniref:transcriptional regulator n=1 Tax=Micromonospora sp. NPDC002575 TaxID=3364222 RepID=UPI0036BF223B
MASQLPASDRDPLIHPLSVVRAARGWTYQDVVDAIAKRSRNMAARREKAWRWEHWGVVPDMGSQLALAAELGVPQDRVRQAPWPQWLPDGDPIPTSFGWTQPGGLQSLVNALEYAHVDRRAFMKITGIPLAGIAEAWLTIEPQELVAVLRGGQVTTDLVERMEEGLPRLRYLEATRGGDRARTLIHAELGMVVDVLDRSAYTTAVGRRLYALAAELGRMAGWASFDAGLHAAAQRYWLSALHAAHAADDRLLGANILKSMSLQCYDFDRPREALELARSAHEGARGATPRAAAMLALREARAHAAIGDATACERLLKEADAEFDRVASTDAEPAFLGYFDESEFNAQVGTCYLDLGRPREADVYLSRTLRLVPTTKVRDRATYVIRRASAQAQLGDADHAASLLAEAIPLIREAPSERNLRRVVRARQRLPFTKIDPRARALDAQLATLGA